MTVAESGSPKYTVWDMAILPPRDSCGEQAGRHQADQDALADGPVQGPDEVQGHERKD